MKKYKKYIYTLAVILIIIAIIGKRAGWFGKAEIFKVAVEAPQFRTITEIITANGKIQPETEVKISADVSGEIVELKVKEGDQVKKGDLLLKINPDIYISALSRIEATLNTSKANLANAKARLSQVQAQQIQSEQSFTRSKKLWESKTISQSEFESAKATHDVALAEVEAAKQTVQASEYSVVSAEASLKEANENFQKTTIYAPMEGTISVLNVELGERVVGTIQMAGTEILRIANLSSMEVKVLVNENDIIRVTLGDTANVEVDAYLNKKFTGVVTEIAHSANSSSSVIATDQVTNFDVKIHLLQDSYKKLIPANNPLYYPFRPGMSATVEIQTETHKNVLAIPIQAVTTRIDTLATSVDMIGEKNASQSTSKPVKELLFVYKSEKVFAKEVVSGIQDNDFIEIISGIEKTDEVVTAPYSLISKKLKDNMAVIKTDKDKLFEEKE
jgi:HlyD family secretion protein